MPTFSWTNNSSICLCKTLLNGTTNFNVFIEIETMAITQNAIKLNAGAVSINILLEFSNDAKYLSIEPNITEHLMKVSR